MLTLSDVLEALSGNRPEDDGIVITEAVIDSREAIHDSLFVALVGQNLDGHDFVSDAFKRGACLALVQRNLERDFRVLDIREGLNLESLEDVDFPFCVLIKDSLLALQQIARFWRRKLDVRVTGITGSVGKSTTKEVTAEVLSQSFTTLKNPGNLNNEIGLPLTILRLTSAHQQAVLEMGFYVAGEIDLLCDIALPHIGVVTNIGTVHAERAGSQEAIAEGKSELVRSLPDSGVAILNYDDPLVRKMAELTKARVFFYGLTPDAELWADEVEGLGLDGIRFKLHHGAESMHLRVPMIGRHSVHTALRAVAVGLMVGMGWQEIITGLRFGHTQLRLVAVRAKNGALLLDDTYNASPQSAIAAINLLEELQGRKIAVLGDMLELGPYERQGHEMVGRRAAEVVDRLIVVGERARIIANAARDAGLKATNITEVEDTQAAVVLIRNKFDSRDVVLVKGSRGMHMDNIVPSLEVYQ
ncbi:MAG: UDP-N-acetylmuramoyl-tripeptide--D-alanyl-D-alanine ligase [Chloroflexi bacterium]|nr:UDP-N-acetylmuramoyl-tripeptide--D-alanyl-D-alanine ligase [Chloroflexota bacterium]